MNKSCQKWQNSEFQSQFSMSKIIRIFLFFFIEQYQFRSIVFVIEIFWQLQFLKQFIGNLIFVYLKRWHFHKLNVNDTRYVSVGLLTSSIICVCICAVCLQPIFLRSRTSVFWNKSWWTKKTWKLTLLDPGFLRPPPHPQLGTYALGP